MNNVDGRIVGSTRIAGHKFVIIASTTMSERMGLPFMQLARVSPRNMLYYAIDNPEYMDAVHSFTISKRGFITDAQPVA